MKVFKSDLEELIELVEHIESANMSVTEFTAKLSEGDLVHATSGDPVKSWTDEWKFEFTEKT